MFKRFLNAIIESRQLHANALVADILNRYTLEFEVDMQLMTPPTGEIFKIKPTVQETHT
jgi:hypothetical protein